MLHCMVILPMVFSSMDGHLYCFHILAAVNSCAQVFMRTYVLFLLVIYLGVELLVTWWLCF